MLTDVLSVEYLSNDVISINCLLHWFETTRQADCFHDDDDDDDDDDKIWNFS